MKEIIFSIYQILSPKERKNGILVIFMAIALGILEAVGVASVMPFLAVAGNPDVINDVGILKWAYSSFKFNSVASFLIFLGVSSVFTLVFSSFFRLITIYVQLRFVSMRRHSISKRLMAKFLSHPYEYFLGRNTSDISKGILSEANEVINQVLKPLVEVISYSIVSLLLVALLVVIDYKLAMIVTLVLGGAYLAVYLSIRNKTKSQGVKRVAANRGRFAVVSEALGGIKEVKLRGLERYYLKLFEGPSSTFARVQSTNAILSMTPKFVIEAVAFGSVMSVAIYFMATSADMAKVVPLLGAYIMAGYRLMPSLQAIYRGSVQLRFGLGGLESIKRDLNEGNYLVKEMLSATNWKDKTRLRFAQSLILKDLSYTYPGSSRPALKKITFEIKAKTTIGIVGATGAGKTTLVDVLLGLLRPSAGTIEVDGTPLTQSEIKKWQNCIGYVPQNIYLVDADIRSNIALGEMAENINDSAVESAAVAAQLHDFIAQSAPGRYSTKVGERGVRLSGGQKQRLGIARALYNDPDILILDEGTSALDSATEAAVMGSIDGLSGKKTIIMIAHRLSTVRNCDQIIVMKDGGIVAIGTYDELLLKDEEFRKVANIAAS